MNIAGWVWHGERMPNGEPVPQVGQTVDWRFQDLSQPYKGDLRVPRIVTVGKPNCGIIGNENTLHAAIMPSDALTEASGPVVCRVVIHDVTHSIEGFVSGKSMTMLAQRDATQYLRSLVASRALSCGASWSMPDSVRTAIEQGIVGWTGAAREVLEATFAEGRDEFWNAGWDAAWDAVREMAWSNLHDRALQAIRSIGSHVFNDAIIRAFEVTS